MATATAETINQETRFSSHWIVGAQGSGKTNLLLNMITADLQKDCSIIVMDSKGDLTGAIRRLALGDRLIVLDPAETPFALNPLDVPKGDSKRAVDQIEYIFGAMLGAKVTAKQQALLRSLLRACVIGLPDPTLGTIQDLIIHGPANYQPYIQTLPPDLQHLFDMSKAGEWADYDATRSELKWRLRLLLESDLIQKIFMSHKTRFKIADAMDAGKVVVIDNAESKVHKDGSIFLGRYFVAQIWAAATARQSRPHHEKKPVFVYIDEADSVIDLKVAEIIDRCRSQRIGLILAHQRTAQIEDKNVLSALENCAIKMVNVRAEAHYFSKLMDIPEDRIKNLQQGQFASEIRGQPPQIIQVPLAQMPYRNMTPVEEATMKHRMNELYGITHKDPEGSLRGLLSAESNASIIPPPKPEPVDTKPKNRRW